MKSPKIKILFNRVLIKQDTSPNKTAGGLFIPGSVDVKSTKGIVMSAGPGMKDYEMQTKKGDTVLYPHDSGIELILDDGNTYLLMRESEIILIM